jgi:hypothetical protein
MEPFRETLHETRSPPDGLLLALLAIFLSAVFRTSLIRVILLLLGALARSGRLHHRETSRFETNLYSERL